MNKTPHSDQFQADNQRKPGGRNLGLLPLHEAAIKLAGMGLNRSHSKTKDLVAMLLSHGARAWRSNQPTAELHLHVQTPRGKTPLRMRIR